MHVHYIRSFSSWQYCIKHTFIVEHLWSCPFPGSQKLPNHTNLKFGKHSYSTNQIKENWQTSGKVFPVYSPFENFNMYLTKSKLDFSKIFTWSFSGLTTLLPLFFFPFGGGKGWCLSLQIFIPVFVPLLSVLALPGIHPLSDFCLSFNTLFKCYLNQKDTSAVCCVPWYFICMTAFRM